MKHLLLWCALLAPALVSAQSWTFDSNVDVPYTTVPGPGMHGIAIDAQGRLWTQNYYGTEPLIRNGEEKTTRALYVLNEDGTQAPCSPILFVKDLSGAVVDTLGYYTMENGTLDSRTGRGMTADPAGNILVSQFDKLYHFDATSCTAANPNSIVQIAATRPQPGVSLTSAAADAVGNVYVTAVVPQPTPIFQYGVALTPRQNVAANAYGINRDILASPDGLVVIDHAFNKPGAVLYYRGDTFSPFDSVGVTVRGLTTESSAVQPGEDGLYWFSSGPAGSEVLNGDPIVETYYQPYAWYGYALDDLLTFDGTTPMTVENPTPRDSIVVESGWEGTGAGPRGLAFSADGLTAYVTSFGVSAAAGDPIKVFVKASVAAEATPERDGFALEQNVPNPFMGRTEIRYALAAPGHARLRVFDVTGRQVAQLVDEQLPAGDHRATFDATGLAAGVYVYTLEIDGRGASRHMAVVR